MTLQEKIDEIIYRIRNTADISHLSEDGKKEFWAKFRNQIISAFKEMVEGIPIEEKARNGNMTTGDYEFANGNFEMGQENFKQKLLSSLIEDNEK